MSDSPGDPLAPHAHEPNPAPPWGQAAFIVRLGDGRCLACSPEWLKRLPRSTAENVFIVSTGHGTSGPFRFEGVALADFVCVLDQDDAYERVEVISADGFGTRIAKVELANDDRSAPILLADMLDGRPLNRDEGLVRLVVPSEKDDALRQVKWVYRINLRNP